jgi:hypothetical protein
LGFTLDPHDRPTPAGRPAQTGLGRPPDTAAARASSPASAATPAKERSAGSWLPTSSVRRRAGFTDLAAGHEFVQNLRRGHYELATGIPARHRIPAAFDELVMTI